MKTSHHYFVYMVTDNQRHTLYIGMTNDLQGRVAQHRDPQRKSFTQHYHCIHLVYSETYGDVRDAIAREKQLKGWTRAKKNALVEKKNPYWEDLSVDWQIVN